MNKSFWLGVLAYLLPSFPFGYFWHLVWLYDEYKELDIYRLDVIIPFGLCSMFIQALFFSWAYPKLFNLERNVWKKSALMSFIVFGLLSWSYSTLPVAAKYQMTSVSGFMWLETMYVFLQFLIVAPLFGVVFRQKKT